MSNPDKIPAHQRRRMSLRAQADAGVQYFERCGWGPWREISAELYMSRLFQVRRDMIEGVKLAKVER